MILHSTKIQLIALKHATGEIDFAAWLLGSFQVEPNPWYSTNTNIRHCSWNTNIPAEVGTK